MGRAASAGSSSCWACCSSASSCTSCGAPASSTPEPRATSKKQFGDQLSSRPCRATTTTAPARRRRPSSTAPPTTTAAPTTAPATTTPPRTGRSPTATLWPAWRSPAWRRRDRRGRRRRRRPQEGPGPLPADAPARRAAATPPSPGTGRPTARPFLDIDKLQPGDEIVTTTYAGRFVYKVTGTPVVPPSDVPCPRQHARRPPHADLVRPEVLGHEPHHRDRGVRPGVVVAARRHRPCRRPADHRPPRHPTRRPTAGSSRVPPAPTTAGSRRPRAAAQPAVVAPNPA